MFHREHLAGSAEPRLDFVRNQYNSIFVTDTAERVHQFWWNWMEAALPLHWLDNDRRDS